MTLVLLLLTAGSAGAALGLLIARAHTRRLEAQLQRQRGIIQRMYGPTIDWYTDWYTEEAGSFPPPPSSAAALDRLIHEVWPHSRERWEDTSTWE